MKKRFDKRIRRRRSRPGLSLKKRGSALKRALIVIGALIGVALIAAIGAFALEKLFNVNNPLKKLALVKNLTGETSATFVPQISEQPEATPHPMASFDSENAETELVFPSEMNYPYLGEPYCFDGKLICPAGKSVDGRVRLDRLISYEIETGKVTELSVKAVNDNIVFPVFNEKWLVYLDANSSLGGGSIMAVDLSSQGMKPVAIKKVYAGQPELKLEGSIVTWIERTGSERDKIFVCDLETQETAVVQYFDRSSYGTSAPSLGGGRLVWASNGADDSVSVIRSIDLLGSVIEEYAPNTYVHDPEFNGVCFAWLDAHHAAGTRLMFAEPGSTPFTAAENVTDFSLSDRFIAYGMNDGVYAYFFETGESYRLNPSWEKAQFLGSSGGVVMWMDVTTRERDIIKYVVLPGGSASTVTGNEG